MKPSEITIQQIKPFLDLITESNDALPYKLARNNSNEILYVFEYKDTWWFVDFQKIDTGNPEVVLVNLTFYENPHPTQTHFNFKQTTKYNYSGSIFGTVVAIAKEVMEHHASVISFTSDSAHLSLYKQLVRHFSKGLFVYRFEIPVGAMWLISKVDIPPEVTQQLSIEIPTILSRK
jgi:hypothetical protein